MDPAQLFEKSVLARALNKTNGFSANKIQQHYLMLDADRNPLFTVADIEHFLLPTTPRSQISPVHARNTTCIPPHPPPPGDTLRETIDMLPLDLGPNLDIILGWDWISSHDLRFLYPDGSVARGPTSGVGNFTAPLHYSMRALRERNPPQFFFAFFL